MKLYNISNNTWVRPLEETSAPPCSRKVSVGEPVLFKHIDGMYSYCKDTHGKVVHLPAWQEVEIIDPPH